MTYTLYWMDGKREIVKGDTPEQAMMNAGYGGGSVRALDFYARGDYNGWQWNQSKREWERVTE